MGFHHFVVEHKHAFKAIYRDTSSGEIQEVHTNRIEGAWKHAKEHFKRINGTTISNFEGHLMEVMFRNWNRQSPVLATLERIVKCYNGVDKYERLAGPFFSSWYQSRRPEPNDTISRRDSSSDEESSSEVFSSTMDSYLDSFLKNTREGNDDVFLEPFNPGYGSNPKYGVPCPPLLSDQDRIQLDRNQNEVRAVGNEVKENGVHENGSKSMIDDDWRHSRINGGCHVGSSGEWNRDQQLNGDDNLKSPSVSVAPEKRRRKLSPGSGLHGTNGVFTSNQNLHISSVKTRSLQKLVDQLRDTVLQESKAGEIEKAQKGLSSDDGATAAGNKHTAYRSRRSLPDRLSAERESVEKTEAQKRFRRRGSVKFADEYGLNMNTFVMIPARSAGSDLDFPDFVEPEPRDDPPNRVNLFNRGWGKSTEVEPWSDFGYWMQPNYNPMDYMVKQRLMNDRSARRQINITPEVTQSNGQQNNSSSKDIPDVVDSIAASGLKEGDHSFHLCFPQPVADLESFKERLDAKLVSLENVRVDDYKPGSPKNLSSFELETALATPSGVSSARKNDESVILCTIKVKNLHLEKSVVARCTYDDWATHADLPAQYMSGVTNLGLGYDTFCFAVRKPAVSLTSVDGNADSKRSVGSLTCKCCGPDVECCPGQKLATAVEFAIRYEVLGNTYWDNNEDMNYRIVWFQ